MSKILCLSVFVAEVRIRNMADDKQENDLGKLSFEEAIKELTSIVGKIEQNKAA